MKKLFRTKGFTLVEVLLVVVIIAILAAVVIVAINPGRQISQANNTQRSNDVRAILNAVQQYSIENRGDIPEEIDATPTTIGSGADDADICDYIVPTYIAEMPFDPTDADAGYTDCDDYDTGYEISVSDGRITVSAPDAELGETISVTQ